MDEVSLRGIIVGAAGVLTLSGLGGGAVALLTRRAQPGADLLGGRSGSVLSRGRRSLVLGGLWSVVVVLAAVLERPLWGQLAFWVALTAGWVVRGVYDRRYQPDSPYPVAPDAPRTSSDPVQRQRPAATATDHSRRAGPSA